MTTKLVNLRKFPFDIYIGRPGRDYKSAIFGNPYKVNDLCARCKDYHRTPGSTLKCFEAYFVERINSDQQFKIQVCALLDRALGCFCDEGEPCHGNIIIAWLEDHRGYINGSEG